MLWMPGAVIIAVLGVMFAGHIAAFFGAGESGSALWTSTRDYLAGVLTGAPALIAIHVLSGILQMDSAAKTCTRRRYSDDGREHSGRFARGLCNRRRYIRHGISKEAMFRLKFEAIGLSELLGVFFSERDVKSLDELAKSAFMNILLLVVPVSAITFWFSPEIAAFYVKDSAETAAVASFALRALAVTVPLQACGDTIMNMRQAAKHMKFVHAFTILNRFLLIVICTCILRTIWGVTGIWLAFPVSAGLLVVLELVVICFADKRPAASLLQLFGLPDKFNYTASDDEEASPSSEEDVVALSSTVKDFCDGHNIDLERSYIFALCVEELGMNVLRHGFADGKKHEMSTRLIYNDGDLAGYEMTAGRST